MAADPGTSPAPVGGVASPRHTLADAVARIMARHQALGWFAQAVVAVAASAVLAVALAQTEQWYIAAGAIGALGLVAVGFLRPAAFLLIFLMLRPMLDELSDVTLGLPGANVAGGIAMLMILLGVALLLRRPGMLGSPTTLGLAAIVVVTAGCSALAISNYGGTVGTEPVGEAVRMLSVLAMFVLAANVFNSPERIRKLALVAGLSGIGPALWALIEWPTLTTTIYSTDIARVSGPFVGPNPLGQYLAITSLILIGMPRAWLSDHVRWLALAPQLVAIVPTYSRVGWIMLVVGIALLEWRRRKRAVIALVVLVAASVAFVGPINDRLLPSGTQSPGEAATYESYDWRLDNWRTLLDRWTQQPFVGYGTGTTIFVNPRRTTLRQFAPDGGFEAHNLVVRVLVEGGLALLLVYVAWALALTGSLRRQLRARWKLQPVVRLLAVLWFLMLLVGLLTDDPFGNTAVLFLLLALTGSVEGAYRLAQHSRSEAGQSASPPLFLPARPRTS